MAGIILPRGRCVRRPRRGRTTVVLLVQGAKTSVFRGQLQLSLGFEALLDLDPDLPAGRALVDQARLVWRYETPTASTLAAAHPPKAATAAVVDVPVPITAAALAVAAQRLGPNTEATTRGVFVLTQMALDAADAARLVVWTW